MDAHLVGRVLRIVVLALGLLVAIDALAFRGPDPAVPRYVLDNPSEHELRLKDCRPLQPSKMRQGPEDTRAIEKALHSDPCSIRA